jgi:hypothetical protein
LLAEPHSAHCLATMDGGESTLQSLFDDQELERRAALVADEYGGIVPYYVEIYGRAIYHSASRALRAFQRFDDALPKGGDAEVVSCIHEALGHCANVSRYFWPSKLSGKRKSSLSSLADARAEKLRAKFDVADESPLKGRALRDSLEHFDERLDRYFLGLESGMVLPDPIVGPYEMARDPSGHIFKLVDPDNEIFVVLGVEFRYGPLRREVQRIAGRTE